MVVGRKESGRATRQARMPRMPGIAVALALAWTTMAPAPVPAQAADFDRRSPRIALVLSGGSARGAAHVGVLHVLEELKIPIDVVVGTSMGAVVGGLWASGLSAADLERELLAVNWPAVFRDEIPRSALSFRRKEEQRWGLMEPELGLAGGGLELPSGLVAGHRLGLLLQTLLLPVLPERDFDRMPIPFRATATDLETGQPVVMAQGSLAEAIRTSMAVPVAFAPVRRDGALLVDGGLVDNLPVDVARSLGADVVIAVDVGSELSSTDALESLLGVASQVTRLMTRMNTERALARDPPDLLIEPDLSSFSMIDFFRSAEMIERGESAARAAAGTLAQWSIPAAEYEAWRARVRDRRGEPPVPAGVRVEGVDPEAAKRLRDRLRHHAGVPLNTARLRADLHEIYGLGGFDRVGFDLVNEAGGQVLVVEVVPRAVGPTTLRFGLSLSDDFNGRGTFQLALQLLRLRLTRHGGELRFRAAGGADRQISAELYQPLAATSPLFASAEVGHRRRSTLLDSGDHATPYGSRRTSFGTTIGAHTGTWGRLTAGVRLEHVDTEGQAEPETFRGWQAGAVLVAEIDRLDDATFPRSGVTARAELTSVREWVGDAPAHDRLKAEFVQVLSRGRGILVLGASGGTAFGSQLPLHEQFRLGGFLRLSGLRTDALAGEEMLLGRVVLLREVGSADVVRLGVALELGDAWSSQDGLSAERLRAGATVLGSVRTVVGSVHFGLGLTEGAGWGAHLFLGSLSF